jgi:ubiquinone/menaquinone biosynthesis C-methylase UbiE
MTLYERCVLPRLIHVVMRTDRFTPYRRRLVAQASGRVLEIGAGSGLNLPFYPQATTRIVGLDPSPHLLARAHEAQRATTGARTQAALRAVFVEGTAEVMPLEDASIDTIVTTWTLCSVPDAGRALSEARRVLKPAGRLLFVEHGRSIDPAVSRWQERLTPAWKRLAGGCHLNRPVDRLIEDAGFRIEQLKTGYMDGPRPMTFMYEGSARPA